MEQLFSEFPATTTDEWMAAIERDLKGADFNKRLVKKTLDGVQLRPFYRAEDLPNTLPMLGRSSPIISREEIREPDLREANAHLARAVKRGIVQFSISLYPGGAAVSTHQDLRTLLEGVDLTSVAIHWNVGPLALPFMGLLSRYLGEKQIDPTKVLGSCDFDPIMDRAARWTQADGASWTQDVTRYLQQVEGPMPRFGLFGIRGAFIEKAGASIGQELAVTAALMADSLGAAQEAGCDVTELVHRSEVRYGVGTNYVLEIAKLRAARLVLGEVCQAFGVTGAIPKLHVITTSSNKTLYDAHNNLLRATIESMSAVIGGADSISTAAYDQGYHTPDEFSEHLSRNTLDLIVDEGHCCRVDDPLGGSYTVERLTADYADAAWELFLRIQNAGGVLAAMPQIREELERVRNERSEQVDRRRRMIVGTTIFSNTSERRLQDIQSSPAAMQARPWDDKDRPDLGAWLTDAKVPSSPFDPFRPSWPFEHLRIRLERHVAAGGRLPKILLMLLGDAKMRAARAEFCQSFLAAGGYDVQQRGADNAQEALSQASADGYDMVVLCSSDPEYAGIAASIKPSGTKCEVWVAGFPEESVESLRALGVTDFIHVRLSHLATLNKLHHRFGIALLPEETNS